MNRSNSLYQDSIWAKEGVHVAISIPVLLSIGICIHSYFPQYFEPYSDNLSSKTIEKKTKREKDLEEIKERHRVKIENQKEKLRLQALILHTQLSFF